MLQLLSYVAPQESINNMATYFKPMVPATLLSRLIIALSLSATYISASASVNYVVPTNRRTLSCQSGLCLTLNDYLTSPENYFNSNSTFVFFAGSHEVNTSLKISGIYNLTLEGTITERAVTIVLKPQVSLIWDNCEDIEINSLTFLLSGHSDFRMTIVSTLNILFHNVTITGNESATQCSAIEVTSSEVLISESHFMGISGKVGAALSIDSSEITFDGSTNFSNCIAQLGGAFYTRNSTIHMLGTMNFTNNTARLSVFSNRSSDSGGNIECLCNLSHYDSGLGGAIFSDNSTIVISTRASFVNNRAMTLGGAVVLVNNSTLIANDSKPVHSSIFPTKSFNLVFNENFVTASAETNASVFLNNFTSNFGTSGALYTEHSKVIITNALFMNNHSPGSGGAVQFNHSDVTIQSVNMINNSGVFAGAMRAVNCTFQSSGMNSFQQNRATFGYAGAVLIDFSDSPYLGGENRFIGNLAVSYGGGLDFYRVQSAMINGTNIYRNNKALFGGAIAIFNSSVQFHGESLFEDNEGHSNAGAVNIETSSVTLNGGDKTVTFRGNAARSAGGSIATYDTQLNLNGNFLFDGNTVLGVGGAMAIYGTTRLLLQPPFHAMYTENRATTFGGAIYFADSVSSALCSENALPPECFLAFNTSYDLLNSTQISFSFINNTADGGGEILYGGQLNRCRLLFQDDMAVDNCGNRIDSGVQYEKSLLDIAESELFVLQGSENVKSAISSPPERLCTCDDNSTVLCNSDSLFKTLEIMPGQEFSITLVTLGQTNQNVGATILSRNIDADSKYILSPAIQSTSQSCTRVSYRLFVTEAVEDASVSYKFFLDGPCQSLGDGGIHIDLSVQPCPVGFMFSTQEHECVCEEMIQFLTKNCYIDNQSINRPHNDFWMAIRSVNDTHRGFVLHNESCPLDYCIETDMNVTLSNPDEQCNVGRQGTLCGTCSKNFSLALGSLHCLPCTNSYLALIIPFALAGIVLIVVLFLLQLTVATGTINGLIFYANIVQANQQAFFPRATINIFTVFIAWLNLDLGIETCFYDGLNIYVYSWLQFLFPLYLWLLIIVIIISCHYSERLSKYIGHNPIAVLGTLLLMSYSKLLTAIIVPLSPTTLILFPGSQTKTVWLYDASKLYFQEPGHSVLGFFAIFTLLLLFLPYTFLLLFGQWIQAKSQWRVFSWINKLKPFLDAYYAPYKSEKRYWLGLYLLARCALSATFAFNAAGDFDINLLVVCSVVAGLSIIKGQVYEKRYNDIFETCFLLNLSIFSVVTFYVLEDVPTDSQYKTQYVISAVSVGIALVLFVGIIIFHACQRIKCINVFEFDFGIFRKSSKDEALEANTEEAVQTNSSVSLRELLLEDSFNQSARL